MTPENAGQVVQDLAAIRQALHATGILLADLSYALAEAAKAEGRAARKQPARKHRRKPASKAS